MLPTCPDCGEELTRLFAFGHRVVFGNLDDADDDTLANDEDASIIWGEFVCDECSYPLADNEDDAKRVLRGQEPLAPIALDGGGVAAVTIDGWRQANGRLYLAGRHPADWPAHLVLNQHLLTLIAVNKDFPRGDDGKTKEQAEYVVGGRYQHEDPDAQAPTDAQQREVENE